MQFHFFSMFGMWGRKTGLSSDPGMSYFTQRVAQSLPGIKIHDSPYTDYQAGNIAALIKQIPESEGVFVAGTSLGACDVPYVCALARRRIDGAFGFQASIWGIGGYPMNSNVRHAHLIYSNNPINLGLGARKWICGNMDPKKFVLTPHHLLHPGDGDLGDQAMFIHEMQAIQKGAAANV